ncbi:tripartite tricarboxylate transporter substrate binding protein [Pusillimonas sp. SM2304]|uniref:Bug family tripartite tricarboxylate transporter substrate binding protein n=1 Tax=Pusillimonas sp. SM2304 TaxID=3073241 RepID=UPI002876D5FB|nr:tripartite tricarboxylate transporter substrate binding protein [Pusillimonas sp. SM2304]MDS1138998.1 tripartite tricarboxylate transporter substrate binding protein [Pusillimonas sp. SM2304]
MKIATKVSAAILGFCIGTSMWSARAADAPAPATTQYPTKPVKIVVPFPPGGTNDIIGRLLAKHLESALGQPFVVENRGGAGGIIGTDSVAKAAADGYTLLAASSGPMATSLALYKDRINYDVLRDFAPVATLIDVTVVLAVSLKFPADNVSDLVRIATQRPGAVRAGLPAVGSMHHLLTAQFEIDTKTELNMIPYKGSGPAILDLIGNHIDIDFDNMPAVIEQIRAGQLKALAVSTPERNTALPDVPSFKELGMNNLLAAPWFVLAAPAGTPADIVSLLNREVKNMMDSPEMVQRLESIGANAAWRNEEETRSFITDEIQRWSSVVEKTGLQIQ